MFELINLLVGPSVVRGSLEVPVAPVVGEDHAVLLERTEDDLHRGRVAGDVERSLQAHAHPHRWQVRVRVAAGEVACGRDVCAACVLRREAQRVRDLLLAEHLVVADEAGEYGKARGVG